MKILHVAPINVAGVPYAMMQMLKKFGHESRLVTLHTNTLTFPEDICLNLPLPRSPYARAWRSHKRNSPLVVDSSHHFAPIHRPRNIFEEFYYKLDDRRRKSIVEAAVREYQLDNFEIIHYDGGADFFRDTRLARRWKEQGKKIVCHYMGSDLRLRGIIPGMDAISDLNLTNESDHLLLHPDIHYIFIPFDASAYKMRDAENQRLRIIHSPSNRSMKGTELILPVIERILRERKVEFILVEGKPHEEVITIKRTCDIAIEQVGNYGGTGYGRNSLENLAMGIPTITEMTDDYLAWLPENPFILASKETLYSVLLNVIDNHQLRKEKAIEGRSWIEKYHSYESVYSSLLKLYKEHGIAV